MGFEYSAFHLRVSEMVSFWSHKPEFRFESEPAPICRYARSNLGLINLAAQFDSGYRYVSNKHDRYDIKVVSGARKASAKAHGWFDSISGHWSSDLSNTCYVWSGHWRAPQAVTLSLRLRRFESFTAHCVYSLIEKHETVTLVISVRLRVDTPPPKHCGSM